MKIILEEYTNPENLGKYAGICYGIISVGHLSVLRFGYAVFKVENISRVCLAQFTRSKHLDYLVHSSRYCDESDCNFVWPESLQKEEFTSIIKKFEDLSSEFYKQIKIAGIKSQDARFVLPQAQATELYVVGNYQAWKDFIKLRATAHAQEEVREIAFEIERQLQEVAPIIFK